MIKEKLSVKSDIEIIIRNSKTKEIIDIKHVKNILTNNGLKWIRNMMANITPLEDSNFNVDTRLTHIAVGDNNTSPSLTQTSLGNELLRKELYPTPDANCSITIEGNDTVIYTIFIDETELVGEILREIGLFSQTFGNFMLSRASLGNLSKTDDIDFTIKYKYIIGN